MYADVRRFFFPLNRTQIYTDLASNAPQVPVPFAGSPYHRVTASSFGEASRRMPLALCPMLFTTDN